MPRNRFRYASRFMAGLVALVLCVGVAELSAEEHSSDQAASAQGDFASWLEGVRAEASARGVRAEILTLALAGVKPIPRIIELDRKQPEVTQTYQEYIAARLPDSLIREGRELLAANADLLRRVCDRFGVQPRFVVALWGVETNYGKHTGGFPVITALATLAYDGRRSAYFRKELMAALDILNEGHISPEAMKGSWAGAMGQSQFMPTSFVKYAVDFDGDGRRDIWTTKGDVFGSAANYLSGAGWRGDKTWGREVRLPNGFDKALLDLKVSKPLAAWQALGVRRASGNDLPAVTIDGSIIQPGGPEGPSYIVYENFETILKWNRSIYFAMSVGLLADRIAGR